MVMIASGAALSTAAYTVSAELVTGQYQFIGKGLLRLVAKGSATGLNYSLAVNGIPVANDQPIMWFGTAGTMSKADNIILEQQVNGGYVSLKLRNTTAGALTCDYILEWIPVK